VGCVFGRAAKERRRLPAAQRAPHAKAGRGPHIVTGRYSFLFLFFQRTVLLYFVQFFEQISYSFFYSNYSNEILIRDCKKLQKLFYKV
jgi:hypothetical protein